jgi:hypothetical protein
MKHRSITIASVTALFTAVAFTLSACSSNATSASDAATTATYTEQQEEAAISGGGDTTNPPTAAKALAANDKASYVKDGDWDASSAQDITLSGSSATTSADGVSIADSTVTITKAGVYKLSGSSPVPQVPLVMR